MRGAGRAVRYPRGVNSRPVRRAHAGTLSVAKISVARIAAVTVSTLLMLLALAGPAAALRRDDGDEPGEQLSTLENLLYFGVIPIGAFALIALLVSLPSIVKGPRYRPGLDWQGAPEWYGAPGAEASAESGGYGTPAVSVKKAGAKDADADGALTGRIVTASEPEAQAGSGDGGGTSARW